MLSHQTALAQELKQKNQRRRLDEERNAVFNQSADLSTYPRKISVRTPQATASSASTEATNTIKIDTENLAQVGAYIDAALTSGATDISDIQFSAKDTDSARRQALAQAVASARSDAEAMARAGGGTLEELLSLSTERTNQPAGVGFEEIVVTAARRSQEQVSTDVIPSQIKVTARVDARWKFVPSSTMK